MSDFFARLEAEVAPARRLFLARPLTQKLLNGKVPLEAYKGYLRETFHFVRHTPRFLAAAAARFPYHLEGVRRRFLKHATEEFGHEKLALHDLEALGVEPEEVKASEPLVGTTALVAFHYYMAERVNPVGLLGTIYTLEGLGQTEGGRACEAIRRGLGLPPSAVTFLSVHAEADVKHMEEARRTIVESVDDEADVRAIIYSSIAAFRLYGVMFDEIWERFEASVERAAVPV